MTDRELVEAAAKAAGIDVVDHKGSLALVEGNGEDCWRTGEYWNPLEDDGDALRLAVKLRMQIEPARTMGGSFVEVHAHPSGRGDCAGVAPLGGDDNAATRRAIVLAAAAVGMTPNVNSTAEPAA